MLDLVISSYVLHGLKPKEREKLYKELCRVSKGKIIFHDYNGNRSLVTDIAELLKKMEIVLISFKLLNLKWENILNTLE